MKTHTHPALSPSPQFAELAAFFESFVAPFQLYLQPYPYGIRVFYNGATGFSTSEIDPETQVPYDLEHLTSLKITDSHRLTFDGFLLYERGNNPQDLHNLRLALRHRKPCQLFLCLHDLHDKLSPHLSYADRLQQLQAVLRATVRSPQISYSMSAIATDAQSLQRLCQIQQRLGRRILIRYSEATYQPGRVGQSPGTPGVFYCQTPLSFHSGVIQKLTPDRDLTQILVQYQTDDDAVRTAYYRTTKAEYLHLVSHLQFYLQKPCIVMSASQGLELVLQILNPEPCLKTLARSLHPSASFKPVTSNF